MNKNRRLIVLFVDDEEEELRPLAAAVKGEGFLAEALNPSDLDETDLRRADLVLVDYTLDAWQAKVPIHEISLRPTNGIALAAVLREHSRALRVATPTAFALITANAAEFGPLPAETRPHVVARLSNLEWFFEKSAAIDRAAIQIRDLAAATASLPQDVQRGLGSISALTSFLGVAARNPLRDRYAASVERCRPPIHYLAERSHGLIIIRWLLHRILPHTCFLFDLMNLAARFGVTPASLEDAIRGRTKLESALRPFRYTGPLSRFSGPRWWRDGIEQWLWDGTAGCSGRNEAIRIFLQGTGASLDWNVPAHPVVTLGPDLPPEAVLAPADSVAALHLDDWPSYAEPAYARRETIDSYPHMKAFIVENA